MDSEPDFKSMMKSARTNGTGIPNEAFQKTTYGTAITGMDDSDINNNVDEMTYDEVANLLRQKKRDEAEKVANESVEHSDESGEIPDALANPSAKDKVTYSDFVNGRPRKMTLRTNEELTFPYSLNDDRMTKMDPTLEALHQMRYGTSFQKTEDEFSAIGTPDAKDPAKQIQSDLKDQGVTPSENENKQPVGTPVPQPASGSDPGCNTN